MNIHLVVTRVVTDPISPLTSDVVAQSGSFGLSWRMPTAAVPRVGDRVDVSFTIVTVDRGEWDE